MARIVYITNGMVSTLNASLELSRQLTDAGHEIIYLSHADISARAAAGGYRFVRVTEHAEIMDQLISAQATIKRKPQPLPTIQLNFSRACEIC